MYEETATDPKQARKHTSHLTVFSQQESCCSSWLMQPLHFIPSPPPLSSSIPLYDPKFLPLKPTRLVLRGDWTSWGLSHDLICFQRLSSSSCSERSAVECPQIGHFWMGARRGETKRGVRGKPLPYLKYLDEGGQQRRLGLHYIIMKTQAYATGWHVVFHKLGPENKPVLIKACLHHCGRSICLIGLLLSKYISLGRIRSHLCWDVENEYAFSWRGEDLASLLLWFMEL